MKIAVLFPGQGSQYLGMGREFIETDAACAAIMAQAEEVCGFPLRQLCTEGPMEELVRAAHLQPAITVTNLICWQALRPVLPVTAWVNTQPSVPPGFSVSRIPCGWWPGAAH